MTILRRARYLSEFAGLFLARALIRALPMPISLWLSARVGDLTWLFMPKRRQIAIDNILQAHVADSHRDAAKIARASFHHFAAFAVEAILAETRMREDNWHTIVDMSEAQELLELARQPGLGFILMSAHFGNWEVPGQVLSYYKPMVAVARRMNNPYTDRLVQSRKLGHQFRTIPKQEITGTMLANIIKQGNILAMLIDQHARYRGMIVPFFGRPASHHTAAALLHLRFGTPLRLACCVRLGPLRYKLITRPVVRPEGPRDSAAIAAILHIVNGHLESFIRAHPEQYLWSHRRWRPESTHRSRPAPPEAQSVSPSVSESESTPISTPTPSPKLPHS